MNLNLDPDDIDGIQDETNEEIDWDMLQDEAELSGGHSKKTMEIDLDTDEDNQVDEEPNAELERGESKSIFSDTKKTAFLSIGIGVLILILGLVLVSLSRGGSNNSIGQGVSNTSGSAVTETQSGEQIVSAEEIPVVTSTVTWIELTDTTKLKSTKTGRFTIDEIQHYGAVIGDTLQTKTMAIGELKGYGTGFEMELPNTLAEALSPGDTITVKYKTGVVDNMVVIGDIESLTE